LGDKLDTNALFGKALGAVRCAPTAAAAAAAAMNLGTPARLLGQEDTIEICRRMKALLCEVNGMRERDDPESYAQIIETSPNARSISFTLEDPVVFLNGIVEVQRYGDLTMEYFGAGSRCVFENQTQVYTIHVNRVGFGHYMRPRDLVPDKDRGGHGGTPCQPRRVDGGGVPSGGDLAGSPGPGRQSRVPPREVRSYRVVAVFLTLACCCYYYYNSDYQPTTAFLLHITRHLWNTTA
jgi:hypothetical protein